MILIGLGANLPSKAGPPRATLEAALAALEAADIRVLARARWYESAPLLAPGQEPDQPRFVNGVAAVATALGPAALLACLHRIEAAFGRRRRAPDGARRQWLARPLDLDLLAYGARVCGPPWREGEAGAAVILPHPRLHERAFVLAPLAEIAPAWRHPVLGRSAVEMLAAAPPDPSLRPIG